MLSCSLSLFRFNPVLSNLCSNNQNCGIDEAQAQLQAQEPWQQEGEDFTSTLCSSLNSALKENIHFHFDSTLKERTEFSGSLSLCSFFSSLAGTIFIFSFEEE